MTILKQTDYTAAVATVISTAANSLASLSAIDSSAIDNSSSGVGADALFMDIVLSLASLAIASASAYVSVYVIPAVDGTNYPHYTTGATPKLPAQYFVGNILFNVLTAAQLQALTRIEIPPCPFKIVIVNNTGVAFAASGNTLAYRLSNYQGV